ncbi:sodium:proton antiporter [Acuticoccus sp. MNP-M23]|uniref:cation:proton antiporter n=1 Tax=Acuticoccus sp. MNP-M23 TaxID=3072793 RepID=UPI002815942F|nr:sodium:proton antiporter [Acuticoccus sp. MNP-M23]WMS44698.1 sodium:proton antiporter [Acuticoccus sp. MNP-M23]
MTSFELIAVLLVLTAVFAWINHRLSVLPHTIGLLVMGLCASLSVVGAEAIWPGSILFDDVSKLVEQINFKATVLDGMLAFLLFAGALHVDFNGLRSRGFTIGATATLGVVISTGVIGVCFWLAASALGVDMPLPWALVFGALVSPTDPVAVLSTLREVKVPADLEHVIKGETLFNDGVGVVLFAVLLAAAMGGTLEPLHVAEMFFIEALGGAVLGAVTGYFAYRAMRAINDYPIEVLVSLALVAGTYTLAARLGLSGPIAVVVAGLLIGTRGARDAMSAETERYLFSFWTLIDEILNSVLFLLIGLEVLILRYEPSYAALALLAVPISLLARFLAVGSPVMVMGRFRPFARGTVPVLTWAGLRGGISVALALSIPEVAEKSPILAATYAVVLFTLIVQGLTLRRVIKWVLK